MVAVRHLPATRDQAVMLVDVGPTMTEIDVVRDELLAFSRSANVGVPFQFGELVMEDSRVSSKAELTERELSDEFEAGAVRDLLLEITRTMQAYRAGEADGSIDQIIIAGGTGIETGLLDAVESRFDLPTNFFDPTPVLESPERDSTKLRVLGHARPGLGCEPRRRAGDRLSQPQAADPAAGRVDQLHPSRGNCRGGGGGCARRVGGHGVSRPVAADHGAEG